MLKNMILGTMISSTILSPYSDIKISKVNINTNKEVTINKSTVINNNSQLYNGYVNESKEEILNKVKKVNKNVSEKAIYYAFEIADEYIAFDDDIEGYFEMVALILAIMEVESNFNNNIICDNITSKDYGIMQVNSTVIPHAQAELNDYTLNVFDLKDNIKMGTWEINKCYEKAKKKHSDNVIWWFYAYYNRGLYFENYSYDYNQANERSSKFIKIFNKYFNVLYNR